MEIGTSFFYAMYICYLSYSLFDWSSYENGHTYGYVNFANMCMMSAVIITNMKTYALARSFTFTYLMSIIFSMLTFFGSWFIFDKLKTNVLYDTFS